LAHVGHAHSLFFQMSSYIEIGDVVNDELRHKTAPKKYHTAIILFTTFAVFAFSACLFYLSHELKSCVSESTYNVAVGSLQTDISNLQLELIRIQTQLDNRVLNSTYTSNIARLQQNIAILDDWYWSIRSTVQDLKSLKPVTTNAFKYYAKDGKQGEFRLSFSEATEYAWVVLGFQGPVQNPGSSNRCVFVFDNSNNELTIVANDENEVGTYVQASVLLETSVLQQNLQQNSQVANISYTCSSGSLDYVNALQFEYSYR